MNISSLIYNFLGLIIIFLGIIFSIIIKYSFYKGMSLPLILTGLIAVTNHQLLINKWIIDCVGLLVGTFIYLYFSKSQQKYWKGVGFGAIISCLTLLGLNTLLLLN